MDWKEIVLALLGLGAAGVAVTFTISRKSKKDSSSTHVVQKNNRVGGNNAGRDINKR